LLTIGLVEDNAFVLNALVLGLQNLGHTVFAGSTGAALLEQLGPKAPDVLVTDYRLGAGETGLDVIDLVRTRFGDGLAALVLTGETDSDPLRSLKSSGIAVCFKPVSLTRLQAEIQQVVRGVEAPT
jgi:CheY-like chemotaxis protein